MNGKNICFTAFCSIFLLQDGLRSRNFSSILCVSFPFILSYPITSGVKQKEKFQSGKKEKNLRKKLRSKLRVNFKNVAVIYILAASFPFWKVFKFPRRFVWNIMAKQKI